GSSCVELETRGRGEHRPSERRPGRREPVKLTAGPHDNRVGLLVSIRKTLPRSGMHPCREARSSVGFPVWQTRRSSWSTVWSRSRDVHVRSSTDTSPNTYRGDVDEE